MSEKTKCPECGADVILTKPHYAEFVCGSCIDFGQFVQTHDCVVERDHRGSPRYVAALTAKRDRYRRALEDIVKHFDSGWGIIGYESELVKSARAALEVQDEHTRT